MCLKNWILDKMIILYVTSRDRHELKIQISWNDLIWIDSIFYIVYVRSIEWVLFIRNELWFQECGEGRKGELHVGLAFHSNQERLTVTVMEAREMPDNLTGDHRWKIDSREKPFPNHIWTRFNYDLSMSWIG